MVVLQTTVAARLNFRGVAPDLVLVSIIAFAVLEERPRATFFAFAASLLQDVLSVGIYLNTIIKTLVSTIISTLKERFGGEEYSLVVALVAIFTPLYVLTEGLILYFFFQKTVSHFYLLFKVVVATVYNLILVPLLFPLLKLAIKVNAR
jgi:rod shape-determining protein MreD